MLGSSRLLLHLLARRKNLIPSHDPLAEFVADRAVDRDAMHRWTERGRTALSDRTVGSGEVDKLWLEVLSKGKLLATTSVKQGVYSFVSLDANGSVVSRGNNIGVAARSDPGVSGTVGAYLAKHKSRARYTTVREGADRCEYGVVLEADLEEDFPCILHRHHLFEGVEAALTVITYALGPDKIFAGMLASPHTVEPRQLRGAYGGRCVVGGRCRGDLLFLAVCSPRFCLRSTRVCCWSPPRRKPLV